MGSKQFAFEVSSWSLSPGAAMAVGGVLVVVMIMATTAICLICYYWGMLLKRALYATAPLPTPPPPPPPSQIVPSDYKVYMTVELPFPQCLPSAVVLMPGEDTPTFLALPCPPPPSCIEVNVQDNNETKEAVAHVGDVEVKVDVYI